MSSRTLAYCSVLISALAGSASGAAISVPSNGGSSYFQENPNMENQIRSLGQTFVLPSLAETALISFEFYYPQYNSPDLSFDFYGLLYEFNPAISRAVGSALFMSSMMNASSSTPAFTGLNIALDPAKTYIAIITTQGLPTPAFANGFLDMNTNSGGDSYTGGVALKQSSSGPNSAEWTSTDWALADGHSGVSGDFRFTANFGEAQADTPEPAAIGITLAGLLALAATRMRRKSL